MVERTFIAQSASHDPWYNLALEELLLQRVQPGEVILYLWQNEQTVVIGRNQNAWRECRCQLLESEGGKLARRLSGGGAVYHDLGNLNFTFLTTRSHYDLSKQLGVILDALVALGVQAEFSGRNDLTAAGRKFSGNAYYYYKDAAMHHGTILVHTDFAKAARYLQPSQQKMEAKGVRSVSSRIINLTELVPDLTIHKVIEGLRTSFVKLYGGEGTELDLGVYHGKAQELYARYASWQWRYGQTPAFDLSFTTRFPWGEVTVECAVQQGRIVDVAVYSDALVYTLTDYVRSVLLGSTFSPAAVEAAFAALEAEELSAELGDVQAWLVAEIAKA